VVWGRKRKGGKGKMSEVKMSLVDKASTQNVVAAIIVVSAAGASIYYGKWELLAFIVGAAISYLFPKKGT
jgi:hypothetical protein